MKRKPNYYALYKGDEVLTVGTKEEIIERLEEIDDCLWNIDMADHWQQEDIEAYDRLTKEKKRINKRIGEIRK